MKIVQIAAVRNPNPGQADGVDDDTTLYGLDEVGRAYQYLWRSDDWRPISGAQANLVQLSVTTELYEGKVVGIVFALDSEGKVWTLDGPQGEWAPLADMAWEPEGEIAPPDRR